MNNLPFQISLILWNNRFNLEQVLIYSWLYTSDSIRTFLANSVLDYSKINNEVEVQYYKNMNKHDELTRSGWTWFRKCRIRELSGKEWCKKHSIPINTFYTKISRLRKKACDIPAVRNLVVHKPRNDSSWLV